MENNCVYEFFSSGFPSHEIDNDVKPNEATVQNYTYSITVNPENFADYKCQIATEFTKVAQ